MNLHKLLEQLASGKSEERLLDIIFDTQQAARGSVPRSSWT